jgi:MutS domain V
MSSIHNIVDTETLATWIGLKMDISKTCLSSQLEQWTPDAQRLLFLSDKFNRFKEAFAADPTFFSTCLQIFNEMAEIEKRLQPLLYDQSKLEKESYNEILFFHPILQPLNFVPFLLTLWSTIRIYILPGISLLFPILTLLAPYIIVKFVFKLPMSFNNYMNILHSIVSGNFEQVINPQIGAAPSSFSPMAFLKQFGVIIVSVIQGIVQPYWSYKHLKSIDTIISEHGDAVVRFQELYNQLEHELSNRGFTFFKNPLPNIESNRDATARIMLESPYFKLALKYVGSLEVIMKLAHQPDLHAVQWVHSSKPIFSIEDTFDFHVSEQTRKTISAKFLTQRHALLTGPNKGGKSTVLRALSISALLAHTYGCSMGHLVATPFSKLFVCLKPDDLPGEKSRFEREVEFTSSTLVEHAPILIFIDELYHSTNPPDALRSCQLYCEKIWNKTNIVSVISTHLFQLVESAPVNIQRICCPATIDKNGIVNFTYSLQPGICKVSSVDTLLKQYHFI